MAHESALQLQLWCAIPFSFAQLLNAPIQINRGAVLKSCESMMGRLFGQFGLFHRAASMPRRVQDDVRDTTINQIRH
jgi:hypothetical protein